MQMAAQADAQYQRFLQAVETGFVGHPDRTDETIRYYWKILSDFWFDDGLVLFGNRIVIPSSERLAVFTALHALHKGIEHTKRR